MKNLLWLCSLISSTTADSVFLPLKTIQRNRFSTISGDSIILPALRFPSQHCRHARTHLYWVALVALCSIKNEVTLALVTVHSAQTQKSPLHSLALAHYAPSPYFFVMRRSHQCCEIHETAQWSYSRIDLALAALLHYASLWTRMLHSILLPWSVFDLFGLVRSLGKQRLSLCGDFTAYSKQRMCSRSEMLLYFAPLLSDNIYSCPAVQCSSKCHTSCDLSNSFS